MPRKGPASRRPLTPDPIYQSQLVTQMINKILLKGKRSTAERIVYSALEQCRRKTGNDPVTTLKRAVENVRPVLETKSRRVVAGLAPALLEGRVDDPLGRGALPLEQDLVHHLGHEL